MESPALDYLARARLRHAAGEAIGLPMSLLPANAATLRYALARVRRAASDPDRLTAIAGYEREVAAAVATRIGERALAAAIGASAATLGWLDVAAATGAYFTRTPQRAWRA
jgi:hypothetical protein